MTELNGLSIRESKKLLQKQEDGQELDLDLVHEFIKQDLDQNEYFRQEHDLDFDIPEQLEDFYDKISEEPPSAERFSNIRSHTFTMKRQEQQPSEDHKSEPELDLSFDSSAEQFNLDDGGEPADAYHINKKTAISIFTLNREYLESDAKNLLLFKNVGILKKGDSKKLDEFYQYLNTLDLFSKNAINLQCFEMITATFNIFLDVLCLLQKANRFQCKWCKNHPTIPILNVHYSFSYQWEKFQDQVNYLVEKAQLKDKRIIAATKQEEEFQLAGKQSESLITNTLLDTSERDESLGLQQSNLESIVLFKVKELMHLHRFFLHIIFLSSKGIGLREARSILKSRFRMLVLLKDKIKFSKRVLKGSTKRSSLMQNYTNMSSAEKLFSVSSEELKLGSQEDIFPNYKQEGVCMINKRKSLAFMQRSKNLGHHYQRLKPNDDFVANLYYDFCP